MNTTADLCNEYALEGMSPCKNQNSLIVSTTTYLDRPTHSAVKFTYAAEKTAGPAELEAYASIIPAHPAVSEAYAATIITHPSTTPAGVNFYLPYPATIPGNPATIPACPGFTEAYVDFTPGPAGFTKEKVFVNTGWLPVIIGAIK